MSNLMTEIYLLNKNGDKIGGLADWGIQPKEDVIRMMREYHAEQKRVAEEVLAASDGDFSIRVVKGSVLRRLVHWVQKPGGEKDE